MNQNIVNSVKMNSLYKDLEDSSYLIQNNLNKVEKLIELLSISFVDDEQKELYKSLVEDGLFKLRKCNDNIILFSLLVQKMNNAYMFCENEFSSKKII